MMSKIKSSKIASFKVLAGIVLAVSLIAVFACEQKESVTTALTSTEKSVTIVADGHPLQITGDSAGIEKIKSVISDSGGYELKSDSSTGQLTLTNKTNNVNEVANLARGNQENSGTNQKEEFNLVEEHGTPPPPPVESQKVENVVFFIVDEMPEYPGGDKELMSFIGRSVKYPPEAVKKGIQGKVFVSFVVGSDGFVSNAKIARGVDPMLDAEALRVVKSMPKWTPGKQDGKDVAVQYTIPINFALK